MKGKDFTQGKWHQSHRPIPNDEDGMYATQIYRIHISKQCRSSREIIIKIRRIL